MRKLVVLTLTLLFLLMLSSVAFAGGWHQIVPYDQHDPDAGKWASQSKDPVTGIVDPGRIPHRNLSTSSNQCKTCHAVHDAESLSFKLLHDTSRATECDFCHAASGALTDPIKKPYTPMIDPITGATIPAKGEHTISIDTKDIPESDVVNSIQTDGLSCGNCHSVHGANTMFDTAKILKKDPASNSGDAMIGMKSVKPYGSTKPVKDGAPDASTDVERLATFCADCHNKNANWDTGDLNASDGDETPNPQAHRIGYVDGKVDIYGNHESVADGYSPMSCKTCHTAASPSKFPHQSAGHKLLSNTYTDTSAYLNGPDGVYGTADDLYTGDPYRPLPNLDAGVCRTCHANVGTTF